MGFDGTFAACSDIKIFYGISGSGSYISVEPAVI